VKLARQWLEVIKQVKVFMLLKDARKNPSLDKIVSVMDNSIQKEESEKEMSSHCNCFG